MMDSISVGWDWLDKVLNNLIRRTNAQKIIPSATVAVQETSNGTLLTVQMPQDQSQQGQGAQQKQQLPQATAVWQNVGWANVITVDPVTCAHTPLTVLIQMQGGSIQIPVQFSQ